MKKWEYMSFFYGLQGETLEETMEHLNSLGEDGWEIAGVESTGHGCRFFLKREKEQ